MKILVTGAKGFVGKNLCQSLQNIKDGKDKTHPNLSIEEIYAYDIDGTKEQLENYSGYRLASERESLDIAPEEVAQAILQVLKEQFAIDEDGLISETARLFGYASVRDNVNASMKRGIEHALKNNMIQFDGGRYKIS